MNESTIFILLIIALGANAIATETVNLTFTPVLLERLTIPYKEFNNLPKERIKEVLLNSGTRSFWFLVAIMLVIVDVSSFSAVLITALNYIPVLPDHAYILQIVKLSALLKVAFWTTRIIIIAK